MLHHDLLPLCNSSNSIRYLLSLRPVFKPIEKTVNLYLFILLSQNLTIRFVVHLIIFSLTKHTETFFLWNHYSVLSHPAFVLHYTSNCCRLQPIPLFCFDPLRVTKFLLSTCNS